jgi:hypothetical protein
MRALTLAVAGWLVFSPALSAAHGDWAAVKALPAGTPVRVNGTADWLEGANDIEIVLRSQGVIPRKQVNRVEVVGIKGNRGDRAAAGVVIGALAGGMLIAVNELGRLHAASVYGGLGGVVGALTGHSSTQRVIYRR